jgi:uncharacterized protein
MNSAGNTVSREFQVFAKPVGAKCNLSCQYCYYLEKARLYNGNGLARMPDEILEKYIAQQIHATTEKVISFSWHGGEPTLAGVDFFRKAVKLQQKHRPSDCTIINGIQTNATLLNEEWGKFLADEGFFVGVSIDGPLELHNKFRRSKDKRGSFRKTLGGIEILRKHSVNTELLTVVNSENVKFPLEVYRFLKQFGSNYMTFLPLVEKDPGSESVASIISAPPEGFGTFLCMIFDEWITEDIGRVKIQVIEEAVRTAFNQEHTLCIFKKTCGGVPVVEHNGDFYSCDHYVDKKHFIGNINEISLAEMLDCERQKAFGAAKLTSLPGYCLGCDVLDMCNGECPKNRFIKTPEGEPGLNHLCEGYKRFFKHVRPFVDSISAEWRQRS